MRWKIPWAKCCLKKARWTSLLAHLQLRRGVRPQLSPGAFRSGRRVAGQKGRVARRTAQFEINAALQPNDAVGQFVFGSALLDQGLAADAIPHLEKAALLDAATAADYHHKLAEAMRQTGQDAEAIGQYEKPLQIQPGNIKAESSLAWMLATTPVAPLRNGARAVQLAQLADQASGGRDPRINGILAAAYAETGNFSKAILTATAALQLPGLAPDSPLARLCGPIGPLSRRIAIPGHRQVNY